MTTPLLAVVRLTNRTALPADAVDMDFSFDAADASSGTLDGISDSLISFFNTSNAHLKLAAYIGEQITRTAESRILFYDLTGHLDGSPHGSPIGTYSWTVGAAASGNLVPAEVAIALSFHGDISGIAETAVNPSPPPATIRPASRRKGRVFFGPVSTASYAASGVEAAPSENFKDDVELAIIRFMDERPDFAVWSRTDEVMYKVAPDGAWSIDGAMDTIRKRGPKANARFPLWP